MIYSIIAAIVVFIGYYILIKNMLLEKISKKKTLIYAVLLWVAWGIVSILTSDDKKVTLMIWGIFTLAGLVIVGIPVLVKWLRNRSK